MLNPQNPNPRNNDAQNNDAQNPASAQHNPPTPEELAWDRELPLQKALMDFDLHTKEHQALGSDPIDLAGIPVVAVKSLITEDRVVCIVAHQGEEQEVADLLAAADELLGFVQHYADHYWQHGVLDFAINALSDQQIRNIKRHRARTLRR